MIPHVKPVFPTEDYPVWTSMATGMQFYISNQGSNFLICKPQFIISYNQLSYIFLYLPWVNRIKFIYQGKHGIMN